ncbi:hypothetical protein A8709_11870 [Paenibacillus pectinilyticus]|uniref:Uncharacterized protein n=1 Tax=Paenibacillus pectinilyticus TaxID=512399 RepID=A0A1C0ZR04_9BACL|nr:hypothetical protein [Paenibacillus pectinilyticus]OCT10493.1 hypothetical protein A8709_11870 [Paenibacillus pectinilyticus]
MSSKNNVQSFAAMKEWLAIPVQFRTRLLSNVYCSNCKGETTIIDYSVGTDKFGVVLEGKCKTCQRSVARVVERE